MKGKLLGKHVRYSKATARASPKMIDAEYHRVIDDVKKKHIAWLKGELKHYFSTRLYVENRAAPSSLEEHKRVLVKWLFEEFGFLDELRSKIKKAYDDLDEAMAEYQAFRKKWM